MKDLMMFAQTMLAALAAAGGIGIVLLLCFGTRRQEVE